uniref:Nucleolar protein 7 n=1 Tax=Myripristis murdjan TaxID=586833 RepID=A0A667YTS4_9TELE
MQHNNNISGVPLFFHRRRCCSVFLFPALNQSRRRLMTSPAPKPAAAESFGSPLDSSDDEAPEEVTFQASKASALQSLKRALDTARREKELLKEKRRRRQELFQEQKVEFPVSWLVVSLKGNYTVQTVKERALASSQQQVALDFLQSRLYGPGSCRTTSNELLSLQNKRGRKKSAAVQFVNKGWGEFSNM